MNYSVSPQLNLNTLYPDQASAVYGKRQKPSVPMETRMEAEKPGYMQAVSNATKTMQTEDQFRKNMQLMEQQLNMQKDAARKAGMIQGAGLAVQTGKLAHETGLLDSLFASDAAEAAVPMVYETTTEAAMAPVATELMSNVMGYGAPQAIYDIAPTAASSLAGLF